MLAGVVSLQAPSRQRRGRALRDAPQGEPPGTAHEEGVDVLEPGLAPHPTRQFVEERLDRDACFEASQRGPQAEVIPEAEGEVASRMLVSPLG